MHDFMNRSDQAPTADWRIIFKLWPYLTDFKWRVGAALALLVLAKVATVCLPIALKWIVDALDPSLQNASTTTPTSVAYIVLPLGLILIYGTLRFAGVLFGELRDAVFGRVAERSLSRITLEVFRHVQQLDLEFHLSRRTGSMTRDIERGTTSTAFLLRSVVFSVVPIFIEVTLVASILLVRFDWTFALVVVLSVVAYVAYSVVVTEWRTEFVRKANRKDSEASGKAIDSLLNYETVKYFNNEAYESDRYEAHLKSRENAKVKNHLSLAALNSGQAFIIAGSMTIMMVMAAQKVVAGEMTLGDLAMVNAFMIQIFMPLNILGFVYREIKRCLADVEQMFALLGEKAKVINLSDAKSLQNESNTVRFESVDFGYSPERRVLDAVSFEALDGQKIALVGASGSGKSTCARLLYRFYDPQGGVIKIGDQDIRQVTQESLRRAIGVVPQDTVLFNDTLYENIRYGNPSASEADVHRAIDLAYLREFIDQLPAGVNTQVGERGLKLSGGEKQRVAIARTILKQPRILIFDEATSALDSVSEQAVMKSLQAISADKTTLIIAHRLSTIVDVDTIVVLEGGAVVEQGNHDALLKAQGVYARLWALQSKK